MLANGEEVGFKDGWFHRGTEDVIAGSALTMIKGVKNRVSYGYPIGDAIKCGSSNPAKVMNYEKKGMIIPGYDGDITVFDKYFNVLITVIDGKIKKNIL